MRAAAGRSARTAGGGGRARSTARARERQGGGDVQRRRAAVEDLRGDAAGGEDVGRRAERPAGFGGEVPHEALGRHVAARRARARVARREVLQNRGAVVAQRRGFVGGEVDQNAEAPLGDHDVFTSHVAVDHAPRVGVRERVEELIYQPEPLDPDEERPSLEPVGERRREVPSREGTPPPAPSARPARGECEPRRWRADDGSRSFRVEGTCDARRRDLAEERDGRRERRVVREPPPDPCDLVPRGVERLRARARRWTFKTSAAPPRGTAGT